MDMDDIQRLLGNGGQPRDYLWIVVIGAFFSVFCAYGIGANDVANAFATSVGAKTLSIKHATVLAGIFGFSGAVLLGSHVTNTIRKGIADIDCFQDDGPILMFGMSCVIFCTGVWLIIATSLKMPVSTTHSVVGGIIGMAIAAKGGGCVVWHEASDTFPYTKGVSAIFLSWIFSPVLSGVGGATFYLLCRTFVLRAENSYQRSLLFLPIILAWTMTLYIFFILSGHNLLDTSPAVAFSTSFVVGVGIALLSLPFIPKIRMYIDREVESRTNSLNNGDDDTEESRTNSLNSADDDKDERPMYSEQNFGGKSEEQTNFFFSNLIEFFHYGFNFEVHKSLETDKDAATIHENAEKFNVYTEEVFKCLQIFTACCRSFGHGANDVANSIGPFAAIYTVYMDNKVVQKRDLGDDAYWILFLGGLGIVLGLATYGYKIMSALGVQICKITPSRGFAIEMGATLVIIIGSKLEIPLSSTYCQVGSTMGVGLTEEVGLFRSLNWKLLSNMYLGWVLTLFVSGFATAMIFCMGAYTPCAM